ncbi:hypothetical protein JTE90_026534 [Oedothorax gibbosus]|uniref:LolA-like domain-containing protein n=1 Tax=Oedothorax gibbosus TaxID=931172 RepID=A0AAV6VRF4_9ARAC|nr:hypothetical protein JTE90_026534 [Oedothorax gibbosus]
MRKYISFPGTLWLLLTAFAIEQCLSFTEFKCPNKTRDDMIALPKFPDAFSTNIRINFNKQQRSIELRAVTNLKENKTALEFWANKRHVKYIQINNTQALIKYDDDSSPTCSIKTVPTVIELEKEDAGPNSILTKIATVIHEENKDQSVFVISDLLVDIFGASVQKWEGCFKYPNIKIALSFTDVKWEQAHTSALHTGFRYVSTMDALSDDNYDTYITALFSHFNPVMPDESEFQPPENVYCKGFSTKKAIPEMIDYFSYDSEIIVYESSMGIAPISSHRRVYYDFPGRISRIDFNDPLAEDPDLFAKVTAQGVSIIHDYNSGVQYNIDPITGKCHVDSFQIKVGPVNVKPSTDNKMQNGMEFFSFNADKIAYNGQFPTRGYTADVFTAPVKSSNGKESFLYTWYFSSDRTQVVENDNVEKDVLLRMVIRPEAVSKSTVFDLSSFQVNTVSQGEMTYEVIMEI